MTVKGRRWCFTLNNPGEDLGEIPEFVTYMVWQLEKGESGTPHFQGYIQVAPQRTLGQMKAWLPTAHWEVSKDRTGHRARDYCMKEDGRVDGPWEIGEFKGQGKRKDVELFVDFMRESKRSKKDIITAHPHAFDRFPRLMEELCSESHKPAPQPEPEWRPWQSDVLEELFSQPARNILWVWDANGNKGKSFLANYLIDNHDALLVAGTERDIACAYDYERVVVVDISRDKRDEAPYGVLEGLKDGRLFSSKYASAMKRFDPPKVICFANFPPLDHKWSTDRAIVVDITET